MVRWSLKKQSGCEGVVMEVKWRWRPMGGGEEEVDWMAEARSAATGEEETHRDVT